MIIGAALIELHVHDSRSLKEKRGVVRSLVKRLGDRFNLSVSVVGGEGSWQRAVLGLTAGGSELGPVRAVLERAVEFVESQHLAEVLGSEIEFVTLPHQEAVGGDPWEEED